MSTPDPLTLVEKTKLSQPALLAPQDMASRAPHKLSRYFPALGRASAYLASILVAAPFLYHLAHGSTAYLGLLEDDYFYYAIVADKLVTLGKLTYDGFTLTNGFHPLWFIVLVVLRAASGRFGPAFYVGLTLVSLTSMILSYELGRRFARELGAGPTSSSLIPAVYSIATARLLSSGMESTVAVPLFLWLLIEVARQVPITPHRAARIGLIASLAILARLDIAIAAALLFAGFLVFVRPPLASFWRMVSAFCAGGILVPLYVAANYVWFGVPLPVSALAKRLQTSPGFSVGYARAVALGSVYGPTMAVVLPLGLVALFLLIRKSRSERPAARFAGGLGLMFAVLFFGINALTGWIFFGWYAYPFAVTTIASLVFIDERWSPLVRGALLRSVAAMLVMAISPAVAVRYFIDHGPRWSIADNTLLSMSYNLADHLRGREGLFAMGAIAGVATYVIDKPVFQIEGILADREMVEHVRREDPLESVLREHRVDYLIVSLASVRSERREGCYLVTQPNAEWAGERSAKMRGEICAEPVAHFFTHRATNRWSVFPTIETLVWDVRDARWKNPASRGSTALSERRD